MYSQLLIVAVIAFMVAQAKYIPEIEEKHEEHHPPTPYKYRYAVEDKKTGDYKSHHEESDGKIVTGEYTVADPDGTIRTVKYTAGKHIGFQAIVTTQGEHDHKVEYYGFPPEFHKAILKSKAPKHELSEEATSRKNVYVPKYHHQKENENA